MATKIIAETFPYDYTHDVYQEYYRESLKASLRETAGTFRETRSALSGKLLRTLRTVRQSYRVRHFLDSELLRRFLDTVAASISHGPTMAPAPPVGGYEFCTNQSKSIRVCIDSNDFPEISESAAAACEIYFKSNYWPSLSYPQNVCPLPNMNPLVGRNLQLLKGMRNAPKTIDLFGFFRVWGGRDELEGIEHNMELFSALSQVKCRKFLLAFLVAGDIPRLGKRLDTLGVPWTTTAMSPFELWKRAAGARLNIIRLGMHQCTPWRLIDILAMGGVPVLDYTPRTIWPQPLYERQQYLSLEFIPGSERSGRDLAEKIESWIQDRPLVGSVSKNTADYFDGYLAPEKLGSWVIEKVEQWHSARDAGQFA